VTKTTQTKNDGVDTVNSAKVVIKLPTPAATAKATPKVTAKATPKVTAKPKPTRIRVTVEKVKP
jgi:hypothetical protein